jgi:hypothetical protein
MNKIILSLIIVFGLTGCASVGMLPQDSASVDFKSPEGKTGWSKYEHIERFAGYTSDQIYEAAKVGLGAGGFSLRIADPTKCYVIGEYGMTAHDWNVMAGVYFRDIAGVPTVKIIVEGSKDIGFSGDVTSDGWTGKILSGMREHLNATYQSVLKVDTADLK